MELSFNNNEINKFFNKMAHDLDLFDYLSQCKEENYFYGILFICESTHNHHGFIYQI